LSSDDIAEELPGGSRAAVDARGLTKTYAGANAPAVNNLSFKCRQGEIITLLGPSGCGKTTTLRMVAGLEIPDAGEIDIEGRTVSASRRRLHVAPDKRDLGMVFQSSAIWPHMTVEQNVAFPLKCRGVRRTTIKPRVTEALEMVGLHGMGARQAPLLSGGQQQRVALARALVTRPKLLLLDEPFNGLDAKLREQMRADIKRLQARTGVTILFVTHDQNEAMSLSHHIVLMHGGEVQQQGAPRQLYESPANEFVRDFLGRSVLLRAHMKRRIAEDRVLVQLDGSSSAPFEVEGAFDYGVRCGQALLLSIRPEDVDIEPVGGAMSEAASLSGTVVGVVFVGDHIEYEVQSEPHGLLHVFGDRRRSIEPGCRVSMRLRTEGVAAWVTR